MLAKSFSVFEDAQLHKLRTVNILWKNVFFFTLMKNTFDIVRQFFTQKCADIVKKLNFSLKSVLKSKLQS